MGLRYKIASILRNNGDANVFSISSINCLAKYEKMYPITPHISSCAYMGYKHRKCAYTGYKHMCLYEFNRAKMFPKHALIPGLSACMRGNRVDIIILALVPYFAGEC